MRNTLRPIVVSCIDEMFWRGCLPSLIYVEGQGYKGNHIGVEFFYKYICNGCHIMYMVRFIPSRYGPIQVVLSTRISYRHWEHSNLRLTTRLYYTDVASLGNKLNLFELLWIDNLTSSTKQNHESSVLLVRCPI